MSSEGGGAGDAQDASSSMPLPQRCVRTAVPLLVLGTEPRKGGHEACIFVFSWLKAVTLPVSSDITVTKDPSEVIKKCFVRVSLLSVTIRKGGEGGFGAKGCICTDTHIHMADLHCCAGETNIMIVKELSSN